MELVKRVYINGETVIPAENLNDIQDAIIDLESEVIRIEDKEDEAISALQRNTNNAIAGLRTETNNTFSNVRAETDAKVENLQEDVEESLTGYGTNLEFDTEENLLYLVNADGERISDGIAVISSGGGGGGGGGGGSSNNAVISGTNTTGWAAKTISVGSSCELSFTWSSLEGEIETGDGILIISVNGSEKRTMNVAQGSVTVDVGNLLVAGSNTVVLVVEDVYGNRKQFRFRIKEIDLKIVSSFDDTQNFEAGTAIEFTYTPFGAVEKTVHFLVDGTQIGTSTVLPSGVQQSYLISGLTHGAHALAVYFTAEVDGEQVSSITLNFDLVVVNSESSLPIISSEFRAETVSQYETFVVPYRIYTPELLNSEVSLFVGENKVAELTVDRSMQQWSVRIDEPGEVTLTIATGVVIREFDLTVTETQIDAIAETNNLVLYLTASGRSNNESNPATWVDTENNISCTMTDFNFVSDGWLNDAQGVTMLRVSGDARVTIPYKPFASDFRTSGKTIELEFATRNILNYDATVISCMNGGRGFTLTAQKATLDSEQSEIFTQYKEDEHVRISFVAEKRNENRLLMIYINGIMSGVVQYPDDDDFSQQTPVNITIGNNSCTTDVYCIRVYDNDLTRQQILKNWIADTQDITSKIYRYDHNNVYDEYGQIVIEKLPDDLPYMVIQGPVLPQSKGDKKTVNGYYVDPVNSANSFSFTNATIDVQGTSSQYYARKNYKIKFNDGFKMTSTGETVSKYKMRSNSIAVKTFTFKADVASSEGANNVELVRLYNDICPYKTPGQVANNKVRQGIDGFPIVIFWDDGEAVSFLGKYNFNNDKGTAEVFGFESDDESWETLNNTSNRVLWKSADYTGSGWLNDFEARYPDTDPAYENPAQLKEFAEWLVSTDTTAATGDALSESVTYEEMDSAIFYYLFTEVFLMVDSRAKNSFPSFMGSVPGEEEEEEETP